MNNYTVYVSFGGYIGSDIEYNVEANSEAEAIEAAVEEAKAELSIESIDEIDIGEYEVVVGFGGLVGVENTYTVDADSEDEAEDAALEEAAWDLDGEI